MRDGERVLRRVFASALVVSGAILAAGCGGGGDGSAPSLENAVTRPPDEWVSGYCADALDLLVFLVDSRDGTLRGYVHPRDAGKVQAFRARLFVGEMKKLGRPDTPDGDKGAITIRELAARELASAQRIIRQTASDPPKSKLPAHKRLVHDESNGSLQAITVTTAKLGRDDAELEQAIKESDNCLELAGDMKRHYPATPR